MKISFCFQGWVSGYNLEYVVNSDDEQIKVTEDNLDEVLKKLETGDYLIYDLAQAIKHCKKTDYELHDFDRY